MISASSISFEVFFFSSVVSAWRFCSFGATAVSLKRDAAGVEVWGQFVVHFGEFLWAEQLLKNLVKGLSAGFFDFCHCFKYLRETPHHFGD